MKVKKVISIVMLTILLINCIIPFIVMANETEDKLENINNIFYDDFSKDTLDTSKWLIAEKAWGGNNGGVVPENVSIVDGILKLEAHGDNYKGDIKGINREDGTRTGAAIATRDYFGSGSYEVVAKVAPELGACSAIWTFEYEEYYPGDSKYEELGATGSYYAVNHEIDIEMPGRAFNGAEASYEYALCNTWIGEKGKEYTTGYTKLPYAQNDGNFHKYRFDWHTGDAGEEPRVEFYFDDELITTNITHIPSNAGRLWIGVWFPNGWAGTPDFDTAVFEIDSVKITPFYEAGDTPQNETYGKDGWAVDSFPEDIEEENYNHIINGDFSEGEMGWNLTGDASVKDEKGWLSSGSKTDSLSQNVSVKPKMTYTITADVITDGTEVTIGARKLNGEGNTFVTVTESGKVVLTFQTDKSVKEMNIYIEVLRYQDVNNEVRVDNVTLYSGYEKKDDSDDESNNGEIKPLTFKVGLKADKTELYRGDEVTITASIDEIQKNDSNGLIALLLELEYDEEIFEMDLDSITGADGWNLSKDDFNSQNLKLVTDSESFIHDTGHIFKVTFKVKDDAIIGETSIKLANISAGTGQDENGLVFSDDAILNLQIQESEEYLLGDIDLDGSITINDLAKLKLHLIEKEILVDEPLRLADIDEDGNITINDLARLKLMLIF